MNLTSLQDCLPDVNWKTNVREPTIFRELDILGGIWDSYVVADLLFALIINETIIVVYISMFFSYSFPIYDRYIWLNLFINFTQLLLLLL